MIHDGSNGDGNLSSDGLGDGNGDGAVIFLATGRRWPWR